MSTATWSKVCRAMCMVSFLSMPRLVAIFLTHFLRARCEVWLEAARFLSRPFGVVVADEPAEDQKPPIWRSGGGCSALREDASIRPRIPCTIYM